MSYPVRAEGLGKYGYTLTFDWIRKFIIESIEIILNDNSFQFNDINSIQTLGTAMRTKMTPTYATLTLAYFEENLYEMLGKNTATT